MMDYNKRTIKKFKSKLIEITHTVTKGKNKYPQIQTGDISGEGDEHLLFRLHRRKPEIPIKFKDIIDIKEPVKVTKQDNYKSEWNQST